jgi:HEAT repeat protein
VAHLKHHDPFVRGEAALAIGWIGMPAMEAAPALLQLVESGKKKTTLTTKGVDAVTPLAPQTSGDAPDYDALARVNAVQALGRLGVSGQRVLDLLTQIARDPKDPAQSAAETSLRQIARPVEFG